MRMKQAGLSTLAGVCLALAGCAGGEGATPRGGDAERAGAPGAYLADFDAAWELVRDTHYDTGYNGVDWEAVRDELRPRAAEARTRGASRSVINEMVGRLNQSHFGLIPAEVERAVAPEADDPENGPGEGEASPGDDGGRAAPAEAGPSDGPGRARPGFEVRVVDGRALVTAVAPGGPADRAGVRPGWVLTRVGTRDVDAAIGSIEDALGEDGGAALHAWQAVDGMLAGRAGSTLRLGFLDGDDGTVEVAVDRAAPPGEFVKFGNLPPLRTELTHRWLTPEETGDPDARVGYVAFNIFMVPIAGMFERAMVEFRDADGLVIDLRGNPGGVGFMASALSRFLVSEPARLGTMTMRGAELQFNVEPVVVTSAGERLEPFMGPVAIVIDGTSASTSEVFAGGLRAIGRAETFGSRTAGMALPAAMSRLPSGDVLLHAIADYENSDGTRLEGDGVPTDHSVPVRREDLLAGVDAPLREAARWIVNETAGGGDAPAGSTQRRNAE